MANLLPHERRLRIERERWARMWIVGAILFLSLLTLGCLSLIPSYMLSRSKGQEAESHIALVKKFIEIQEKNGVRDSVRITRLEMEGLSRKVDSVALTDAIDRLVDGRGEGIALSHISIDEVDSEWTLTVSGNATTRGNLLSYVDRLEGEAIFEEINLPVSNLAKSADIDFLLQIKLRASQKS